VETALTLDGRPLPLVGPARIYVCGITPYDVTHLGHAATFVWTDTLSRVLRYAGAETRTCRNVTDVDRVLTEAARRADAEVERFAAVQQFRFDQDMTALGVRRPEHEPRARQYVAHVVRLAAALLDGGAAYQRGGGIYLRDDGAAARAGRTLEESRRLQAEFGDDPDDPAKDDPRDATVWAPATGTEPAWDAPWGRGRPGWHAECAAMVLAIFGSSVDVHAGGTDLAYPHHTYEAAMAEAVTGVRPFSRAWFRVGQVRVAGQKMAKSTGNLVLLEDLLEQQSAAVIRLLILDRRWDEPWDFTGDAVAVAGARLDRLYAAGGRGGGESAVDAVAAALFDNLDVPRALAMAEDAGGAAARVLTGVLGLT
jgi:cysteinyl-tRNA synthetase